MIRGITKIRNEAHIIQRTLDNWAQYCDAIHVYDDCSDDGTADICRAHPAVVEVISSDLFDPDRLRAEWFNRQAVLSSAMRFSRLGKDWIVYFDGDEWLYNFNKGLLDEPGNIAVACRSFDVYVTPEDVDVEDFEERQYVSPAYEFCWYFYRCAPHLKFHLPDQRSLVMGPARQGMVMHGDILHWGKGLGVDHWEKKCRYYTEVFGPKYQAKWEARKGQCVHDDFCDDFGNTLVKWDDVKAGVAAIHHRGQDTLVR